MSTLPTDLRNKLERTCIAARNLAERAAKDALKALAVHQDRSYDSMSDDQRNLRKKLVARAKAVGDTLDAKGQLVINHLAQECAYEHWHRMLFARFLAENSLLMLVEDGETPAPITLKECKELADAQQAELRNKAKLVQDEAEAKRLKTEAERINQWTLAGRYAQTMLPEIFRADDPVLQVPLAREDQLKLEQLLAALAKDTFTASDSLGWCYQFWQAERKDQVNAAGNKIGADELPSVTQLFTEDYMVDFLLDNTLGAWHAGRRLKAEGSRLKFATEEEVRQFCALPGCPWRYLRFVQVPSAGEAADSTSALSLQPSAFSWTPAAGTFDGWPKTAKELKCLDPCMGSGHFVVAMFERLVALRMAGEKLDEAAAVAAVIRDNLFGLEIDPRCTQIGAFNLALAAWRRVGHRPLPAMNLACSGLAPNTREADWLAIVDAASSRTLNDKQKRQDAAATFSPINYFRPDEPVANLTGNLPHWRQEGTTYFVTFRCADALPQEKLHQWQQELEQWQAAHPEPHDESTRQEFYERFPKRIQTWLDSGYGECVLHAPAMREIVESALRHFDGQRYRLAEFVVAANHVHALVTPLGEHRLSDILHSWKSFTANKINEARRKSGAFWQKESFDHIVRSPASLAKFREYIQSHKVQSLEGSATPSVAAASSRSQPEEERLEAAATMKLKAGMERLYRLFQKAAVLGSLINPRAGEGDLLVAAFHELQPLLEKALQVEEASSLSKSGGQSLEGSATLHEMAVTARGLAKAAEILAGQFTLVATNVPYLGRRKQVDYLKEYCERVYPDSKADLATCFIERCFEFCREGGNTALVTPQVWLFLGTYKNLRERLLKDSEFDIIVRLGPNAFQDMNWWAATTAMFSLGRRKCLEEHLFSGLDVAHVHEPQEKAQALVVEDATILNQKDQLKNPDATIVFEVRSACALLSEYAESFQGSGLADIVKYRHFFWENERCGNDWVLHQSSPNGTDHYSGMHFVTWWENGRGALINEPEVTIRGRQAWEKSGIACAWLGRLPASLYLGTLYDNSAAAIIPRDPSLVAAIWCFCSSAEYLREVRKINQKSQVANATLVKVPFDLAHWQKVAAEKYPHGLPKPFSSDPTQWLFNGHPVQKLNHRDTESTEKTANDNASSPSSLSVPSVPLWLKSSLQVAVARLLGYQWPRQTGSSFPDCPALGPDGLEKLADDDGIVCLPSVRGEEPAAERLRKLLSVAAASSRRGQEERLEASATFNELELIRASGSDAADLEEWLRNDFFEQHCDLFHQRPFIWHIWDGRKRDGFHALVNYHKLAGSTSPRPSPQSGEGEAHKGRRTLESLTHSYLGDWITRQKDGIKRDEEGADERLAAALALKETLEAIINGEGDPARGTGFDIFVRWKPLAQQAIGWNLDINDGVRMNIRPFLASDIPGGKKGAGILRARPNIKWDKDRGKEPKRDKAEYPWFYDSSGFTGDRVNDVHLTKEQKEKARK